jgi:hypothetical protein
VRTECRRFDPTTSPGRSGLHRSRLAADDNVTGMRLNPRETIMSASTLPGMKIEIAGHDGANRLYRRAEFVVTNCSISPLSVSSSAEQLAAVRQWAAGQTPALRVESEQPVEVEVSDLDGVRCRLVCYQPGTRLPCGSSETTDRQLLAASRGEGGSCALG